ncbi:MAG: hypothetical protein Q4D89_03945 [Arachnia propionica]|uniref:hypothetical protein n=1 Tax=Arachnia propionica TaxID=1750 RepID=UPI0026FA63C9|nr:hypothetical protein [Arachnia propionica]
MRWVSTVMMCVLVVACSPGDVSPVPGPATSSAGMSLSEARSAAFARLDEMRYADVAPFRKQVEEAESSEKIDAVMGEAVAEDVEAKERYWACAGHSLDVLQGSGWETSIGHPDSFVTTTVRLTLHEEGSAALVVPDGTKEELLDLPVKDELLVEHVDRVTAWESDAEELIAAQEWIGTESSSSWWGPKACVFPFNLTLVTDDSKETVYAKLKMSQTTTLSVFGLVFTLNKES